MKPVNDFCQIQIFKINYIKNLLVSKFLKSVKFPVTMDDGMFSKIVIELSDVLRQENYQTYEPSEFQCLNHSGKGTSDVVGIQPHPGWSR